MPQAALTVTVATARSARRVEQLDRRAWRLLVLMSLLVAPAQAQIVGPRQPVVSPVAAAGAKLATGFAALANSESSSVPELADSEDLADLEDLADSEDLAESLQQACELTCEPQECLSCPGACACCRREFWVVDSRCAPTCCCTGLCQGVNQLRYLRLVGEELVEVGCEQFFAAMDPSLPTTLYVHGNGLDPDKALKAGLRIRDDIGRNTGSHRFVLWSWPAEGEDGLGIIGNLRMKLERCHGQGYYMAWVVDRLHPDVRLSLAGHSYGCRVVCSALQCLAASGVAGCSLEPRQYCGCRRMQAALVAAAMDNDSLLPGQQYGLAVTQVNRILVAINPKDRVLAMYPLVSPSGSDALGATGIPQPGVIPSQRAKVQTIVTTAFVFKSHRFLRYTNSRRMVAELRPYFFDMR